MTVPCAQDSTKPQITVRIEKNDTLVCMPAMQFRKIDFWLTERDWLKTQYELQKQAIGKCDQLSQNQEKLNAEITKDRDYWRKLAKGRNGVIIAGSFVFVASIGAIVYLALR